MPPLPGPSRSGFQDVTLERVFKHRAQKKDDPTFNTNSRVEQTLYPFNDKEVRFSQRDPSFGAQLCKACGLCCNGAIFADVRLRSKDDKNRLSNLGLTIKSSPAGRISRLLQPCAAYQGCQCRIYPERPDYCRQFECALLKKVLAGVLKKETALQIISQAIDELRRINQYLVQLGNNNEKVSHKLRFTKICSQFDKGIQDKEKRAIFSELTIAVHKLDLLLAESFYPGSS